MNGLNDKKEKKEVPRRLHGLRRSTSPDRSACDSCVLIKSVDDALEVGSFQCSATNQTTVNIGFCKQFLGIGGLAAATVEDGAVVSDFLAILLGYLRTDESMDSSACSGVAVLPVPMAQTGS